MIVILLRFTAVAMPRDFIWIYCYLSVIPNCSTVTVKGEGLNIKPGKSLKDVNENIYVKRTYTHTHTPIS